ncbi:MAG TPA: D-alanyl-D-alanine endopeptidase [Eoetvoesiella sp.]|uniref:D-alanyl-D-alanine endopeptidase n=1 Tax=Eoetvoesiella sp. TaxID=1966355 RepID=UPI002BDABAAA|nr:D-alanyl-D-alanine endopeptidase [Eoetvoesiella sp.]HWK62834.1 D-alanyl-D-alanine endopeptidase [Eoetvoesiella sp.]
MQAIQNKAPFWVFAYLIILAFGLCSVANARTSTPQSTHSAKKASTAKHKKAAARKGVQKSKIVTRRSLRSSGKPSKIQVGLRERQLDDIIMHRPKSGLDNSSAQLRSEAAFVLDLKTSTILYDKNSDEVRPIASISKLMTALIVTESGLSMSDPITISEDDVDHLRHSRSRLAVGTRLSRAEMLHLALMSSENRAAHALARYYPGGMPAFVRAMNDKARSLGMRHTHFIEPTGLSSENVSTARDLVKLLRAASKQALIHRYTTDDTEQITLNNGRQLTYNNSNQLVKNPGWDIKISKTGFINEAGECLVMVTRIDGRDVAMVLLNSTGRYSRIGDAVRMRAYVERGTTLAML